MKTSVAAPKIKHGTVRDDGMVFWAYNNGKEYWVTNDRFESIRLTALRNKRNRLCKNKEILRGKQRSYAKKRADKNLEYSKRWRSENREWVKERTRIYRLKNIEKIRGQARARRLRNADKVKLQKKAYAIKYPDVVRASKALRRARKRSAAVPLSAFERGVVKSFYADASRLSKSFGIPWHVDHIIPISRDGKHHPSNLQLLTARANIRKGSNLAA